MSGSRVIEAALKTAFVIPLPYYPFLSFNHSLGLLAVRAWASSTRCFRTGDSTTA